MRNFVFLLLAVVALPALAANNTSVEAELKRMTNELLDAIAPGNADVFKRYVHERLLFVSENNEIYTKAQLVEQITPLPKGLIGELEVGAFKAEVHGNVAVTSYVADEKLEYHGQRIEQQFRTSDTWLKTKDGWRMIASQTFAILYDPPAMAMPRAELCTYAGTYQLTPEIKTTIACGDDGLVSERTGRKAVTFKPEVRDLFFQPGAPRTRRIFLRDANGAITAFVDRREARDIRWVKVQ